MQHTKESQLLEIRMQTSLEGLLFCLPEMEIHIWESVDLGKYFKAGEWMDHSQKMQEVRRGRRTNPWWTPGFQWLLKRSGSRKGDCNRKRAREVCSQESQKEKRVPGRREAEAKAKSETQREGALALGADGHLLAQGGPVSMLLSPANPPVICLRIKNGACDFGQIIILPFPVCP